MLSIFTSLGWPIILSYSVFRIVLVFGEHNDGRFLERAVAALGGVLVWYGRLIFGLPGNGNTEWTLALALIGMSLMVLPKLIHMTWKTFMNQQG